MAGTATDLSSIEGARGVSDFASSEGTKEVEKLDRMIGKVAAKTGLFSGPASEPLLPVGSSQGILKGTKAYALLSRGDQLNADMVASQRMNRFDKHLKH